MAATLLPKKYNVYWPYASVYLQAQEWQPCCTAQLQADNREWGSYVTATDTITSHQRDKFNKQQ
jgi:hypothetical protein